MSNIQKFEQVLFIGPNYKKHKGGMGAVLEIYEKNIACFNFIASYNSNLSKAINPIFFVISIFKLFWILLNNTKIKIVHIHGASDGSFYRKYIVFLISKYFFKKKIIYHVHTGRFHVFYDKSNKFVKKIINQLLEDADHIVCLSQYWKTYFSNTFKIQDISILDNPIEIPINNSPILQDKCLSLLFLGIITDGKGIFDLLNVIIKNRKYYQGKLKLVIGGVGQEDRLVKMIKSNNIEEIVDFVGWVNGDYKLKLLSECNVLILPSYNEGLPICILEAMSFGKAIISTKVGGIPEIVIDGENGFLVDPGDAILLERSIENMLEDVTLSYEMGKKSSNVISQYDVKKVIKDMETLYDKLLS